MPPFVPSTSDELPDLPKQKEKLEAKITTDKIMPWVAANLPSCAIEIKATYKKSIGVSALADHQIKALAQVATGTFVHKLSDAGHTRQPFDAIVMKKMPAYVIVAFCGDDDRIAMVIPIQKWCGATVSARMHADYVFKL